MWLPPADSSGLRSPSCSPSPPAALQRGSHSLSLPAAQEQAPGSCSGRPRQRHRPWHPLSRICSMACAVARWPLATSPQISHCAGGECSLGGREELPSTWLPFCLLLPGAILNHLEAKPCPTRARARYLGHHQNFIVMN